MKFAVDAWDPSYAQAERTEAAAGAEPPPVRVDCEMPLADWRPVAAAAGDAGGASELGGPNGIESVLFTDGVRNIDARAYLHAGTPEQASAICASYAAGAVRVNGKAELVATAIRRAIFTSSFDAVSIETEAGTWHVYATGEGPDAQAVALQDAMGKLEKSIAAEHARPGDLVVLDGPISGGRFDIPGAIGYVKTHRVQYLPSEIGGIIGLLAPGERTPVFYIDDKYPRFSWYLRLPGRADHTWACIVRCEASPDHAGEEAVALATTTAALLPRFASEPHSDPRAPQNLVPVGALERELRHCLGDRRLIYRALMQAAAQSR